MRLVALGGNALLRRTEPPEAAVQRRNVVVAARSVAALAARQEVVVEHGNGRQDGLLALQAEALPVAGSAGTLVEPEPAVANLPDGGGRRRSAI